MITLAEAKAPHVGRSDRRVLLANESRPLLDRLLARVSRDEATGCHVWTGATTSGYGIFQLGSGFGTAVAHRVAYLLQVGPIPEGMELDHLCRNRACVNLAHLEVVTHRENGMRGSKVALRVLKEHCPVGHDYAVWGRRNGLGHVYCQACKADQQRQRRARKTQAC